MNKHATFQRLLVKYASWISREKKKPHVLELGCGEYSTPLLYEMGLAFGWNYKIVATDVEKSSDWACFCGNYHMKVIDSWDNVNYLYRENWDLVFIDNNQLPHQRLKMASYLIPNSRYVIMHDADELPSTNLVIPGTMYDLDNTSSPYTICWKRSLSLYD